jgi:hypothetical protein
MAADPAEDPAGTFIDVPPTHWAYTYIETLYEHGYIAGCNADPPMYCPEDGMTRAESAVFIERGIHGAEFLPADPNQQTFADVPLGKWFTKWAEGLWADAFTAGCATNPLLYCPFRQHTRAEGAVFFLRMLHGVDYRPPDAVGLFSDASPGAWYARWVEAAYEANLIPACQTEPQWQFCPEAPLNRAMAAFIMTRAKNLAVPGEMPAAAAPIISPSGGSFEEPVEVSITSSTEGAQIRFTLDGRTPAADSTLYTGPIQLEGPSILKARSFAEGYRESAVARADFEIAGFIPWPEYPSNPFSFSIPEAVHKYQFLVSDLDGDGLLDYTFRSPERLFAYGHDGGILWQRELPSPLNIPTADTGGGGTHGASDVDRDGHVEVIALRDDNTVHVFEGSSGALETSFPLPTIGEQNLWAYLAIADLDGDGDDDLILQTLDTSGSKRSGYMNRSLMGWDLEQGREVWRILQDADPNNGIYEGYWGQAHGPFRSADVDGDGRDEIVGGNLIQEDGEVIDLGYPRDWIGYNSDGYTDHIDAVTIGDFRPDLPGLEWVVTEEDHSGGTNNWHTTMLSTSGIIWRVETDLFPDNRDREPQNVAGGNFDPGRSHEELWVRSRFSGPSESQHPWVFDSGGTQFADFSTQEALPPGFNTHEYGNKQGLEIIVPIDWLGSDKSFIAAKARHVNGNIGVFDAVTGEALWYTPNAFPAVQATMIYVADVAGDYREEVIIYDIASGAIKIYANHAVNPKPMRPRKWSLQFYARMKQNWNYYSP